MPSRHHFTKKQATPRRRILSPKELKPRSNNKIQQFYLVEKYKTYVHEAVEKLDENFKKYQKCPDPHPLYEKEWNNFWSRRYGELKAQGKNANDHEFKPEWIVFWTKRMMELHEIEIAKKKEQYRKQMGLSRDEINETFRKRSRTRSSSPQPSTSGYRSKITKVVEESSDSSSENEPKRKVHRRSKSPEKVFDSPINLISACRLLSALEPELGLLAQSITDLLAKAVAEEKNEANSADKLLMDSNVWTLLGTSKEKLKGVITANLIPPNRVVAVKLAIQNIAILMHENTKNRNQSQNAGNSVENIKKQIAEAITENLLKQGRTDVTNEELEALVESFIKDSDEEDSDDQVKIKNEVKSFTEPIDENENAELFESLDDDDLKVLMRNFGDLSVSEQSNLVKFLNGIEKSDPNRIKSLKKFLDAMPFKHNEK